MPYASKTFVTSGDYQASRDKRLSICLAANGFSFAEVAKSGQLLTLGEAEGVHAATFTQVMADVKAYFAEVGIRPIGYASMELIVPSNESAWVPDELYSTLANRKYLKLVGGTPESIITCHSNALASTAVFSANEQVVTAFKVALPGLNVMHQHAKMAQAAPLSRNHPVILAHWRQGRVDVAAFSDGRYIYGNTLSFSGKTEATYHIVEVMKTYELDNSPTELLLCGDVDRHLYGMLLPYFPKVSLYSGSVSVEKEFRTLHTYRHALMLI